MITLTAKDVLPEDGARGALAGRVWLPHAQGPAVVAVRSDGVFDVSARFATIERAVRGGRSRRRVARARKASGSAISMPSSPTRRRTSATRKSRGCWRRSICR